MHHQTCLIQSQTCLIYHQTHLINHQKLVLCITKPMSYLSSNLFHSSLETCLISGRNIIKLVLSITKLVLSITKLVLSITKLVLSITQLVLFINKIVISITKLVFSIIKLALSITKLIQRYPSINLQGTYNKPDFGAEQGAFWPGCLVVACDEHTSRGRNNPGSYHENTCNHKHQGAYIVMGLFRDSHIRSVHLIVDLLELELFYVVEIAIQVFPVQ